MIMLSPNFSWAESMCHDGTPLPDQLVDNARKLANDVLEPIRAKWGSPLIVLSWYRTPAYNKRIGGAKFSQHMTGCAADIRPVDARAVSQLYVVILGMLNGGEMPSLGGLGRYPSFTHVDIHKLADGHVRRWTGTGFGSEMTVAEADEEPTEPGKTIA